MTPPSHNWHASLLEEKLTRPRPRNVDFKTYQVLSKSISIHFTKYFFEESVIRFASHNTHDNIRPRDEASEEGDGEDKVRQHLHVGKQLEQDYGQNKGSNN